MGETNQGDNDLDDDDSNSGQNPEEGEDEFEGNQDENQSPEEVQPSDDNNVDDSAEEPAEEVTTPEEPEEKLTDAIEGSSNALDAVESTDTTITVKYVEMDGETEKDAPNSAKVVYLRGCVDGGKLAKGRPLEFKVEPAAGRKITGVSIKIGEGSASPVSLTGSVYSVPSDSFITGSGADAKSENAELTITTAKVSGYKVTFAKSDEDGALQANTYEVYAVTKAEGATEELLGEPLAAATDVAFGEEKKFAIIVKADGDSEPNELSKIVMDGVEIPTKVGKYKKTVADEKETEVLEFTVNPSDSKYPNLSKAHDDGTPAPVTVKVVAKSTLTIDAETEIAGEAEITAPTVTGDTYILYDTENGFDDILKGDAKLGTHSLAFKVGVKSGNAGTHKIKSVTVTAVETENTDKTVAEMTAAPITGKDGEYSVSLKPLEKFDVNTTLIIKVEAELDDSKTETVRTINFKKKDGKAPEHVTINYKEGSGDSKPLKDSKLLTNADTVTITIVPDMGYELSKGAADGENKDSQIVSVVEKRSYKAAADATDYTVSKQLTATEKVNDTENGITLSLAKGSDKKYKDNPAETDPALEYIVTALDITIETVVEKNNTAKTVTFANTLAASGAVYDVTNDKKLVFKDTEANEKDEENHTWWISKSVQTLDFTVTSTVEPKVTCPGYTGEGGALSVIQYVSAAENVYTYSIPVAKITNNATITIERNSAASTAAVKAVLDANDVKVTGKGGTSVELGTAIDGVYTLKADAAIDSEIEYTFEAKKGAVINKVSYTVGDSETPEEVTADKTGKYVLKTTVTGDIKITVESKSDVRVVLYGTSEPLEMDGDTYVIDYDEAKDITVKLEKAETAEAINFYNVVVKEGGKTAATEVEIKNDATAVIAAVDPSEYGSVLTIEVYQKNSEDEPYTAKLRTTKQSGAVTVTYLNDKNKEENAAGKTLDVKVDSVKTFTVKAGEGAKLKDLGVEILPVGENPSADEVTAAQAKVTPYLDKDTGELTLTMNPNKEAWDKVKVSIYNTQKKDNDGNPDKTSVEGGSFILNLTDPLVKSAEIKELTADEGVPTNRDVRLNLNLTYTDKKNAPVKPEVGTLYYKVEPSVPASKPDTVTLYTAEEMVQYIPLKLTDGRFSAPAEPVLIPLVKENTEDATLGRTADIDAELSTTVKVTLIQTLKAMDREQLKTAVEGTDYVAYADAKSVPLKTKKPIYETKLTVKSVNGAAVFTGQSDVKVATPTFTADTSYNDITVQFVNTKTGEEYGTAGSGNTQASADSGKFKAYVDAKDNSIYVSVESDVYTNSTNYNSTFADSYKNALKNLGVKVTAEGPDSSYRASAVVKLKVQQGIYSIGVDESKATLPTTILKTGKKATVKITPLLNGGSVNKPAKSNVTWEIKAADAATNGYMASVLKQAKSPITFKNGTVNIDTAKYTVQTNPNDNKFTVVIKAADFNDLTNSSRTKEVTFEITEDKMEIGSFAIVKSDGTVVDEAAIGAEDFEAGTLYVVALKSGAKLNNQKKYDEADYLPVTFKSSSKTTVDATQSYYGATSAKKALLTFKKPGSVKITAATVDGGKMTSTFTFEVKPFQNLALRIVDSENIEGGLEEENVEYSGGSNEEYSIYTYYKGADDEYYPIKKYKNLKIKVTDGKFFADKDWKNYLSQSYMGNAVVVNSTKNGYATITLTDSANKDKNTNNVSYKITNKSWNNVKAPTIKMTDPKKVDNKTKTITWQVTERDKSKNNYAGYYVNLAVDNTVRSKNGAFALFENYKNQILKIDENGQFKLSPDGYSDSYSSYKLIATIGTMEGGEFKAAVKDVKLNFNVPVKKGSKSLAMTTSYTLDGKAAASAKLVIKNDSAYVDMRSNAMSIILSSKDQKKDLHANGFADYFVVASAVDEDGNPYQTIGLRSDLTEKQVKYITSGTKEAKADCQGYVTLTDGSARKDFKITINFKDAKYSLTGATIFANQANQDVTANVKLLSGKTAMKAVDVKVLDAAGFAKASGGAVVVQDGSINIVGQAGAGKYKVKLKVLPETSGYIVKKDGNWVPVAAAEGETALASLAEVCDKYGVEAEATIDVKDLATTKVTKVKSLSYTITPNDYERGAAGSTGNYVIYVPYTTVIGGTDIAANDADLTKTGVKVNLVNNKGEDQNKVVKTPAAEGSTTPAVTVDLVKAEKAVANVDDKEVPAIKISVSKEALLLLTAQDPKSKPVTAYGKGKKLKVPVEIKYDNGVSAVDTLTFTLTMPTTAPADLGAVEALVKESKAKDVLTKNLLTANKILDTLESDVRKAVENVIPKDSDVYIASDTILPPLDKDEEAPADKAAAYAAIMQKRKAVITLKLVDNAKTADNTKEVPFTYDMDITASVVDNETSDNDVQSLKRAIEGASLPYMNTTTKDTLLKDIKEIPAVANLLKEGKGNLSLKVTYFKRERATVFGAGSIEATITIKNLADSSNKASATAYVSGEITILDRLDAAADNVKKLFNEAGKVTAIVTACSNQEDMMEKYILAKAKAKVNNDDITIEFVKDEKGKNLTIVAPNKEDSSDGTLNFTLLLKNKDGKEVEIESATGVIDQNATYASMTEAKKAVEDVLTETALQGLTYTANTEEAVKTVIKTAIDAVVADLPGYSCDWVEKAGTEDEVEFSYKKASATVIGEVTFKLTLKLADAEEAGIANTSVEISKSAVKAVKVNPEWQTEAELRAEIEKLGTQTNPIKGTLPANLAAAPDALKAAITAANINTADPAIKVQVKNVEAAAGVTATTYEPDNESSPTKAEYKNVQIIIGEDETDTQITFTHPCFYFEKASTGG